MGDLKERAEGKEKKLEQKSLKLKEENGTSGRKERSALLALPTAREENGTRSAAGSTSFI